MQRRIRDANAVNTLFGWSLMGIEDGRLPDSCNYVYEKPQPNVAWVGISPNTDRLWRPFNHNRHYIYGFQMVTIIYHRVRRSHRGIRIRQDPTVSRYKSPGLKESNHGVISSLILKGQLLTLRTLRTVPEIDTRDWMLRWASSIIHITIIVRFEQ